MTKNKNNNTRKVFQLVAKNFDADKKKKKKEKKRERHSINNSIIVLDRTVKKRKTLGAQSQRNYVLLFRSASLSPRPHVHKSSQWFLLLLQENIISTLYRAGEREALIAPEMTIGYCELIITGRMTCRCCLLPACPPAWLHCFSLLLFFLRFGRGLPAKFGLTFLFDRARLQLPSSLPQKLYVN